MEKKSFNLFYFVILISGVLYTNVCFSQNTPTTWQDRIAGNTGEDVAVNGGGT